MNKKELVKFIKDGLNTDGVEHKQWYLWRILEAISPKEHKNLLEFYGKEDGIVP
jgi:hypothetical protein